MRSVRTRVLPEPAGAITRTGPAVVGDRRELVGGERRGRRAADRRAPGRGSPASTALRVDDRLGRAAGTLQRGPPSIQASPPCSTITSAPPPSSAPARAAFSAHHQTGSPLAGVVVVRPDEVVEAVERQVEVRGQRVGRASLDRRGLAELRRVDRRARRRPARARLQWPWSRSTTAAGRPGPPRRSRPAARPPIRPGRLRPGARRSRRARAPPGPAAAQRRGSRPVSSR